MGVSETMEMALGMSEAEANDTGLRGTDQGTQMKTDYGWDPSGVSGTNSSGFSGLPGGQRNPNGYFNIAGIAGIWWSATHDANAPWRRDLYSNDEFVSRFYGALTDGLSVRCIEDSE